MIHPISSPSGGISFVDPQHSEMLRHTLLHAYDHYGVYRAHFDKCGLSRQDIAGNDLHTAFAQLSPIRKQEYSQLQSESLRVQRHSKFVVDPSSGTTGTPVLKFTSKADDDAEAAAVAVAFQTIGIGQGHRCACLDIGASQIYLFYMRVLKQLGVRDSVFLKVTADHQRTIDHLRAFDPDVIISIPSVLKRCLNALTSAYAGAPDAARKILYIGEPMENALRRELEEALGGECFSFYGTTELGSICIECSAHVGMHVPLDLFVPTICPWPNAASECIVGPLRYRGTVAWTSLQIQQQPVVKYQVNDLVDIDIHPCGCGSNSPRLIFHQRIDETFFLYGITFTYQFFLELLELVLSGPVQLEIRLVHYRNATNETTDSIILVLDESFRGSEDEVRERLSEVHPLSELIWCNFVQLKFEFVPADCVGPRKGRRVLTLEE